MWLIGGAAAVVAVAVIWLGVRTLFSPAPDTITPPVPAISTPEPAAPGTPSAAPEQPAPGPATTPAPTAAPATTTPPPPAAPSTPSAPAASASSDPLAGAERFEIVVASFRTEERAAVVASEVMTLGLPMRRRASDGWQQVLAGPFATRADAAVAQQRLEGAGLTGTAIVPATR
jgi:cell division protein FtsN